MSYSMDNMPEAMKGMPAGMAKIFIAAYNAADEDGKSEADCNKIAWAAVKKEYEEDSDGNWKKKKAQAARVQRGELIALAEGDTQNTGTTRTIQVIRAGDFVDMSGKAVTIGSGELDAMVTNSNAALGAQEIPVEIGHPTDPGAPAAAWYRTFYKKIVDGVEWVCAEIELTSQGAQALGEKLYKYFSAEMDLDARTITGGGFVNRPAVGGQQVIGSLSAYLTPRPAAAQSGGSMDKPKSLFGRIRDAISQALSVAELEMSQEDLRDKLRKALDAKYSDPMMDDMGMRHGYIVQTYADRVVVEKDGKYFELPYTLNAANEIELGEPVEGDVSMTFTPKPAGAQGEAQMSALPTTPAPTTPTAPSTLAAPTTAIPPAPVSGNGSNINSSEGGESNMPQPTTPVVPVTGFEAQLTAAREQMAREHQAQLAEFDRQLAAERVIVQEQTRAEMQRKQDIATLAAKITTGRHAFPQAPKDIETLLLSLTDADRQLVTAFLEKTHESGLVEFGERGSSAAGRGHKELAAFAKPLLREWLAKGGSVEEFFTTSPELGKAGEYDLYEFEKK